MSDSQRTSACLSFSVYASCCFCSINLSLCCFMFEDVLMLIASTYKLSTGHTSDLMWYNLINILRNKQIFPVFWSDILVQNVLLFFSQHAEVWVSVSAVRLKLAGCLAFGLTAGVLQCFRFLGSFSALTRSHRRKSFNESHSRSPVAVHLHEKFAAC